MGKLIRFEIFGATRPQGIGFMQGLSHLCLTNKELGQIYPPFEVLPLPNVMEPSSFWFTEEGLWQFEFAIDGVQQCVLSHGWVMKAAIMDESQCYSLRRVYKDDWQVALPQEATQEILKREHIIYTEYPAVAEIWKVIQSVATAS